MIGEQLVDTDSIRLSETAQSIRDLVSIRAQKPLPKFGHRQGTRRGLECFRIKNDRWYVISSRVAGEKKRRAFTQSCLDVADYIAGVGSLWDDLGIGCLGLQFEVDGATDAGPRYLDLQGRLHFYQRFQSEA